MVFPKIFSSNSVNKQGSKCLLQVFANKQEYKAVQRIQKHIDQHPFLARHRTTAGVNYDVQAILHTLFTAAQMQDVLL